MFAALWASIIRVVRTASGSFGVLSSIIGTLSQWLGRPLAIPGWAWISIGAFLFFATACRVEWELIKEKEKNRKPQPTKQLEGVVKQIIGKDDIFGPDNAESMQVLQALEAIREKALHGLIDVFGCDSREWRATKPAQWDMLVRHRIPADHWRDNRIDYLEFANDRFGEVRDLPNKTGPTHIMLWFDQTQVDSNWPRKTDWKDIFRFWDRSSTNT
jgi:hypothetical protein